MSKEPTPAAASSKHSPIDLPDAQGPSLQLIYETAPIGLAFLSPDCRYLRINRRLTDICGISVEGHLGRTVRECVPALADSIEAIVRSVVETGEPVVGVEVASQRTDEAEERAWITYWHPVHGSAGAIVGVNVAAEEITERKRTEAALRASEQQFRTLADAIPQLVWMSDAEGKIFWSNSHLTDFTGMDAEAIEGQDWSALLVSEGTDAPRRWDESLRMDNSLDMELSLRRKDDEYRPFLTRVVPLSRPSGEVYRWIGTHIDISEQKRREAHIQFIVDELAHRTKNLLSVVLSVARQTARQAQNVQQYHARFSDRLTALAHCHDLLVRDSWYGAPFADLVSTQLKPFCESHQTSLDAAGPHLVLKPDAVLHLGLAFHELATNASKHGALSSAEGRISIRWSIDEAKRIHVHWRENGGPVVSPPRRRGFGHVVIQQIVPRALNGNGALDFPPEGVNWTFEFPAQA